MNEKIYNLLNDPNVLFFLTATPDLKRYIEGNHPMLSKLRSDAKQALMEDKVIPLHKDDVYKFVTGGLDSESTFLFSQGNLSVNISPNFNVNKNEQKNI
jgi:hypothetical protein